MWQRGCNEFYREDDWGNRVPEKDEDKCTFVSGADCPRLMMKCIKDGSCKQFFRLTFDVKPHGITDVKQAVMKINPHTAYRLLGRLGFGVYLDDAEPGKMRYYKIQSVDSWENDLRNMSKPDGCDCMKRMVTTDLQREILNVLNSPRGVAFKEYLKVLVEWVNANPTVLNPNSYEVQQAPANTGVFKIFGYQSNLSTAAANNLYKDYCDVSRVQASIVKNVFGNQQPVIGAQVGGADTSNLDEWWQTISKDIPEQDRAWVDEQLDRVRSADSDFKPQETLAFLDRIKTVIGKKLMLSMVL